MSDFRYMVLPPEYGLGYLAGWPIPAEVRATFQAAIPPSARAVFGQPERRPDDVGYVADWGLLVHARETALLSDVPGRRGNAT